jgi:hypothetical protein
MRKPMDDPNTTTGTFEPDEDILTYTVSDEAIEAAAGTEREGITIILCGSSTYICCGRD